MKVGVNILNFGPGADPASLLGWAQVAESLGYHSVMISDHVAITPSVRPRYPEPFFDTFTTLAWLAGQTKRVQLGTTVCVLPYRHPVLTAREAANIDQLSGGRFIFGVGVGNAEDEFRALGVPHARRGRLGDECLQAIRALWTQEGFVSFKGRVVNFEDVSGIRTHQQPHPPIWVGGASEAALRRAVRHGDAYHPIYFRAAMTFDEQTLEPLRRIANEEGKPMPRFCPRIRLTITDAPLGSERLPGTGNLDQVRSDLVALEGIGAEHVILDWNTGDLDDTRNHEHGWQQLATLADKVLDLKKETLR